MVWVKNVGGRQTKVEDESAVGAKWRKSGNNIQCVCTGVGTVFHYQLRRRRNEKDTIRIFYFSIFMIFTNLNNAKNKIEPSDFEVVETSRKIRRISLIFIFCNVKINDNIIIIINCTDLVSLSSLYFMLGVVTNSRISYM